MGPPISASASPARAHPPVVVLDGPEEVLDRVRVTDFVQDLDGRPSRVLGLVFQGRDKILDSVGMVDLDDHVDGLVLHLEIRVL